MPELLRLEYVGDGAFRPSLPARSMDKADIEDNARRQKRSVEEIAQEAVGSGLYVATYEAGESDAPDAGGYPSMNKPALVDLAESRGLPKSGTKDEIVARLVADDEEKATEAAEESAAATEAAETPAGEGDTTEEPGENPEPEAKE